MPEMRRSKGGYLSLTADQDFAKKQTTIAEKVLALVQKYPTVKEDFAVLVNLYWYYNDGLDRFIPYDALRALTPPDSISRAFRKLVEQGKIVLPPEIAEQRKKQQKRFRRFYGKGAI